MRQGSRAMARGLFLRFAALTLRPLLWRALPVYALVQKGTKMNQSDYEACKKLEKLLSDDASYAEKKIISDACAEIQANDDPTKYDAIVDLASIEELDFETFKPRKDASAGIIEKESFASYDYDSQKEITSTNAELLERGKSFIQTVYRDFERR